MTQKQLDKWHCKVIDDWLPLPAEVLALLGWGEGTELEILSIANDQLVIRKKDALKD